MKSRTEVFINDISFETPPLDFHLPLTKHYEVLSGDESISAGDRARYNQLARFMKLSGVEHRYSVIGWDNSPSSFDDFIRFQGEESSVDRQSIAERMNLFEHSGEALIHTAISRLFRFSKTGLDIKKTTHIIVVSCTGFYSPFLDAAIVDRFGLSQNVKRLIVGFMGCHGGFNGLRTAYDIVRADPESQVLVVALELCTLHRQNPFAQTTTEDFQSRAITNSLFGDACAAAVVSAKPIGLQIFGFNSHYFPAKDLLTWNISATGFEMGLKKELPEKIPTMFKTDPELAMAVTGADEYAIHPGGRKIISAIAEGAGLSREQLARTYDILRNFGNTSSTSIFENLRRIMEMSAGKKVCAIGLGPGIQVETARFVTC